MTKLPVTPAELRTQLVGINLFRISVEVDLAYLVVLYT